MSKNDKQNLRLLDAKLGKRNTKIMIICAVIMLASVLLHDLDHIIQANRWSYNIPLSLWALNLIVYVLPVVSIFLAKSRRMSATLVCCLGGIVTSLSFVVLHCFGSSSGLNWGVWNYTYFELMQGGEFLVDGEIIKVAAGGITKLDWILLFHVPLFSLPCSGISLIKYLDIRKAVKEGTYTEE